MLLLCRCKYSNNTAEKVFFYILECITRFCSLKHFSFKSFKTFKSEIECGKKEEIFLSIKCMYEKLQKPLKCFFRFSRVIYIYENVLELNCYFLFWSSCLFSGNWNFFCMRSLDIAQNLFSFWRMQNETFFCKRSNKNKISFIVLLE